jgi:D-arabinose 1-dehydrogenase-like Zn-dependent alcohol dehydrogenase
VQFGKAFGQHVTVISRSEKKREMAMGELGADAFIASSNEQAIKGAAGSLDAVIDTVSAEHDFNQVLSLLKTNGKLVCVGAPPDSSSFRPFSIISKRLSICGSLIGGIKETQEMLDFCAEKKISCTCEVISADYVNEAFRRMGDGDVHFRFVIDTLRTSMTGL